MPVKHKVKTLIICYARAFLRKRPCKKTHLAKNVVRLKPFQAKKWSGRTADDSLVNRSVSIDFWGVATFTQKKRKYVHIWTKNMGRLHHRNDGFDVMCMKRVRRGARTFRPRTFRPRTFWSGHFGHGRFGHGKCRRWTFRP